MLKLKAWLEGVDPYAIHRIAFHKALFISTVMVYVYWIFHPQNFVSFVTPFLLIFFYELPIVNSFQKKDNLLLFIAASLLFVNITFDLIYPFKFTFFFYSIFFFVVLHKIVLNYFYAFKNLSMLIIGAGAIILNMSPSSNFQVVYDMVYSMMLSLIALIICLRIAPNRYFEVWKRALQNYIECLEADIEASLKEGRFSAIQDEITRFELVRNYQCLVEKKYILPTFRIANSIRNIQLSLDNLYYEEKNNHFWGEVKMCLNQFKHHLARSSPYEPQFEHLTPKTTLQQYVLDCLTNGFTHWNRLCNARFN